MIQEGQQQLRGFDLVLQQLIDLNGGGNTTPEDFKNAMRELLQEREMAVINCERLKQQEEMAAFQARQDRERQQERREFHELLQRERREAQNEAKEERQEHFKRFNELVERQDQERLRQDQARREERIEALEQQDKQHGFFREVIAQLQEEVRIQRNSEGAARFFSDSQGEPGAPGKHRTPASSFSYPTTPLSLMETPSKPFEDSIGSEVVENFFAAGGESALDETDKYAKKEPTSVRENAERSHEYQRANRLVSFEDTKEESAQRSDQDPRARRLVSFEDKSLLKEVGNKVENAKGGKLSRSKITQRKSKALRSVKGKMTMIAGKKN